MSSFLSVFSFLRNAELLTLNISAAKIAAFLAPAFPMDTVATGIPAGICDVLNSASIPSSRLPKSSAHR